MSAKPITRIRVGSVSLPFYPHSDGWRWAWKDSTGVWRYGTRKDRTDAMDAAKAQARMIHNGKLDLDALSSVQLDLIRQFLALDPTSADLDQLRQWRDRKAVVTVADALARWHAHKLAELGGVESRTLRGDFLWLEKMAAHFGQANAPEIPTGELQAYIEAASTNQKSRKTYRTLTASLWRFAGVHEVFISTAAERLPLYKQAAKKRIEILSPAQAKLLLKNIAPEFRAWLVLNLFSGLRAQEIISHNDAIKPSLRWENVRRADKVIDVPADVSKRRKRRIIPILPTLEKWLAHINPPDSGKIVPSMPTRGETARLGELIGGWPRNVLRHSYGSYRAADTKDAPALALEMGNSVTMIEAHYMEAVGAADSAAFWGLVPPL